MTWRVCAVIAATLVLAACGDDGDKGSSIRPVDPLSSAPTAPADAPGFTNVMPTLPTAADCRPGTSYDIAVMSPPTNIDASGVPVAFTVFEPSEVCGNKTYPLILNGAGFGQARTRTPGAFASYTSQGYGVISFDNAGIGDSGGKIRVMDPDQEGRMLLAVMDWAHAKLKWLAYGPTLDGGGPDQPIMGANGGSYGGMAQFLMLNLDKRHRLRAIAPQIAPSDLRYANFPGGVIKTLWQTQTYGSAASGGNGVRRNDVDPYLLKSIKSVVATGSVSQKMLDFFGYHSPSYFYNNVPFMTNGEAINPADAPQITPTRQTPRINALIYIGVRDTQFNFNNGYENYMGLKRAGGDVRLLSYQLGHNSFGTVPDPYNAAFYPTGNQYDSRCGKTLTQAQAEIAFFNEYLQGQRGSADIIPAKPCISLSAGDGVLVDEVPQIAMTPALFTSYPVDLTLTSGELGKTQTQTIYIAPSGGALVLGIPHIRLTMLRVTPAGETRPLAFVGLCVAHVGKPGVDLVNNQVTPLRGSGSYDQDLVGGGVRLVEGDQLQFCAQGLNEQYAPTPLIPITPPVGGEIRLLGSVQVAISPSRPSF